MRNAKHMMEEQIEEIFETQQGTDLDKCVAEYHLIECSDNPVETLQIFMEYDIKYIPETEVQGVIFSEEEFGKLYKSCVGLVNGILEKLTESSRTEQEFYSGLWECIHHNVLLGTQEEKVFVLFWCRKSPRTPFYSLASGVKMSDEDYCNYLAGLQPQLKRMEYVLNSFFGQRTEQASLLMDLLEEGGSREEKSVLLSVLLKSYSKMNFQETMQEIRNERNDSGGYL